MFKPYTVNDYVKHYNQKFGGQVKYEAIPWAQYHPTMETRALAGEYPYNEHGGPYDRDEQSQVERGGIQTHHHAPAPATR